MRCCRRIKPVERRGEALLGQEKCLSRSQKRKRKPPATEGQLGAEVIITYAEVIDDCSG